ncbi:putative membrane protein [Asticcacaulis biprosthecium C19]|uniref:Putative membrane protein n=1 Tax=Asticcacaulis biprosthecium C19 TaxID=715226 RepID=F4QPS5_9CAUL|nr:hypothetical protein [Asticcacaulis biprosthecium]EGF90212.1 putative membrane protein [Asticcacaulis biprosthecium C19]
MKKTILALITACLGCCALLFLAPALSGASLLGLSLTAAGFSLETLLCALPVALLLGWGVYAVMKARKASTCRHDGSCGCKTENPQAR